MSEAEDCKQPYHNSLLNILLTSKDLDSVPDGKICLNSQGELAVTKFAVEPVWYLPGVAERFGIGMSCSKVRLALFCTKIGCR